MRKAYAIVVKRATNCVQIHKSVDPENGEYWNCMSSASKHININDGKTLTETFMDEHIEDIIKFIEKLIKKQVAYTSKNGVYFSVSKFPEYGKLSKKKIDELQSGARIEVDEAKNDPLIKRWVNILQLVEFMFFFNLAI